MDHPESSYHSLFGLGLGATRPAPVTSTHGHPGLQVAEGLNAMGQKQHLIEQMQLEIRSLVFRSDLFAKNGCFGFGFRPQTLGGLTFKNRGQIGSGIYY